MITEKQGYEAMVDMVKAYVDLTGSEDITDILGGGEYLSDGEPADPVFWVYWEEAIEKVKNSEPPITQHLNK